MPHRVLRLITRLNIGGPARHVLMVTKHLSLDFPTQLATGMSPPSEGELIDPEVPVHRLPLVRSIRPLTDVRAFVAARRLIQESRPALVDTHMAKAGVIGRLAAASVRPRPKTVHTFHGHVLEGYFRPAVQRAFVRVESYLARRTDALVAVSAEVRDDLLGLGIGTPERFHVIPPVLDLSSFSGIEARSGRLRRSVGIGDDTPLVGMLGRLAPIKDHAAAIAAVARLDDVHLAILGDGELRERLGDLAASLGITHRVHFLGWWNDVAAAISDLDVVLLTSRNEGTPVSLIEALAAGRPVVATDVGGVRSVVDDGVNGFLCPPADTACIAEKLRALLASPDERRRFGTEGRWRVNERFGHDRLLKQIADLYSALVS